MSNWIDVKKEDIDLDNDGSINILYGDDDFGNNYVTIKLEDVFELIKEKLKAT